MLQSPLSLLHTPLPRSLAPSLPRFLRSATNIVRAAAPRGTRRWRTNADARIRWYDSDLGLRRGSCAAGEGPAEPCWCRFQSLGERRASDASKRQSQPASASSESRLADSESPSESLACCGLAPAGPLGDPRTPSRTSSVAPRQATGPRPLPERLTTAVHRAPSRWAAERLLASPALEPALLAGPASRPCQPALLAGPASRPC